MQCLYGPGTTAVREGVHDSIKDNSEYGVRFSASTLSRGDCAFSLSWEGPATPRLADRLGRFGRLQQTRPPPPIASLARFSLANLNKAKSSQAMASEFGFNTTAEEVAAHFKEQIVGKNGGSVRGCPA